MKARHFFIVVIFFLVFAQNYSQQKLTLEEAIKIALENNYDIRLAKNDAAISENNYSLGNAGFLPKLDITASQTKSSTNTKQEYSDGRSVDKTDATSTSTNANAALSWVLFDGFKMFTTYSKLREYKELGNLKLRSQIEKSISEVIQTYYNIVQQKYNYRVAQEGIEISRERVRLVEEKLSVGSASNLDLLRAKVDLNADRSNLLNQEVTLNTLKVSFNVLLARSVSFEFDVEENIDIQEGLTFNALKESAFKNNIDLLQSEKNINISSFDAGILKSDYFPKLTLNSGYNFQKSEAEANLVRSNQSNGYNYGLSLSWNIFNGFNTQLAYQNALISLDKYELLLQATKNYIKSSLLIAFRNYEKNIEILKLENENISTSKENLDLAFEQFKLGSLSPLEFREVQKSYIAAQSRLSTARYSAKMSERDLLKQSGMLLRN